MLSKRLFQRAALAITLLIASLVVLTECALAGTPTACRGYTKPTPGADNNAWGQMLNGDLDIIDANLSNVAVVTIASTSQSATGVQAQSLVQKLTGTLTGATTYSLPNTCAFYIIDNETAGAFKLQVQSTTAVGPVTVPQGTRIAVYIDTTGNMIQAPTPQAGLGFDQQDAIVTTTGAAGHYVLTLPTAPAAYVDGMFFIFRADKNSTGLDDFAVNGLAAHVIDKAVPNLGLVHVGVNTIIANNIVGVVYDATFNVFHVVFGAPIATPTRCVIASTSTATCSNGGTQANNGTYTPITGATRLLVRMIGGGGGGGAQSGNAGGTGGSTTFGTATAGPGTGGTANGGTAGSGGSASGCDVGITGSGGAPGSVSTVANVAPSGGNGGSSAFGGAGSGGSGTGGFAAATNSGSGGGGGAGASAASSGSGGGSGAYCEKMFGGGITSLPSTFSYGIGSAGSGGAAGVLAGGNGALGIIIVDEWYGN